MATTEGLDPQFSSRIQALVAASGGRVWIVSGYRSVERQQQLWDKAVAKYGSAQAARKWVAPPGSSNHNRGVAVDLGGDLGWAKANAGRFGLHTPMSHEPWHFEPVGLKSSSAAHTHPPDEKADEKAEEPDRLGGYLATLDAMLSGSPAPATVGDVESPTEQVEATVEDTADVHQDEGLQPAPAAKQPTPKPEGRPVFGRF